ncbi:MAG: HD domain-containing protein [Bacteroidota bacterium]
MSTKDYSSLPIRLLAFTGEHGSSVDQISSILKTEFPGLRSWSPDSGNQLHTNPGILLIPVQDSGDYPGIEILYRHLIENSQGTVIRSADGVVHSKFIPVALKGGDKAPPSISCFLDGSRNQILGIGEPESHERSGFILKIDQFIHSAFHPHPATPDLEGIQSYIRGRFKIDFPPLAYHNPLHIEDVYQACLRIAEAEKVDEDGVHLLRVAALFHDAGFIHSMQLHEQRGADMAAGVMPVFGYSAQQVALVRQMILATKVPQSPASLLDSILCDADLDYLGRDDFYPIGNRLFEELKIIGVVQDELSWNTLQRKFLSAHRYHTAYGRNTREPVKQIRLREIEAKLA